MAKIQKTSETAVTAMAKPNGGHTNSDAKPEIQRMYENAQWRLTKIQADPDHDKKDEDDAWEEREHAGQIYFDAKDAVFLQNDFRIGELTQQLKDKNRQIEQMKKDYEHIANAMMLVSSAIVLAGRLVDIALGRL